MYILIYVYSFHVYVKESRDALPIYICVGLFMYILIHIYRSLYVHITASRDALSRRHVSHGPPDKLQHIRLLYTR